MVSSQEDEVSFAGRAIKMDSGNDAKEIVDAIEACSSLRVLKLEGNTMGVEAAELIGKALGKHSEFERAKWSDMFTGRLKTEIPPALKHLGAGIIASAAKLVELDLSDNAFGPIGVEGIADLLRSSSCFQLRELRLNNNGLGPNGGKMLAEVLEDTFQASSKAGKPLALRVFVSGRGRLENDGAKALSEVFKKMGSLEYVSMPQNGINPPGIMALSQAFAFNTNLQHINLSDNTFTVSGAKAFAEALPQLNKLEVLNLESCLIRNDGAKAVAKALDGDFPALKEVILNYNEITKSGAVSLVETLGQLSALEVLQLDGNNLGEEGKELVRGTLEAMSKESLVGSLSEDEGTEDEDEEETDQEAGHPESSGAEADEDTELPAEKVSPQRFMELSSLTHLKGLDGDEWTQHVSEELSSFSDEIEMTERLIYMCMKLSAPLTSTGKPEIKNLAFGLCDKTFEAVATKQPSSVALNNSILVNLGVIKSENKKFKPATDNVNGMLMMTEHIVRSDYYPRQAGQTLYFYLTHQGAKKMEPYFQCNQQLLQTLFAL